MLHRLCPGVPVRELEAHKPLSSDPVLCPFSFGRLPWSKLLGLVASVAQDGFNVTHDLGEYLMGSQGWLLSTEEHTGHCFWVQGSWECRWLFRGNHGSLDLEMDGVGSYGLQGRVWQKQNWSCFLGLVGVRSEQSVLGSRPGTTREGRCVSLVSFPALMGA